MTTEAATPPATRCGVYNCGTYHCGTYNCGTSNSGTQNYGTDNGVMYNDAIGKRGCCACALTR